MVRHTHTHSSAQQAAPPPYSPPQFSEPLRYPDHGLAMDLRALEKEASSCTSSGTDPRRAKELVRQLKGQLLQLRQANRNKERMAQSFRNATLAGGKVSGGGGGGSRGGGMGGACKGMRRGG